MISPEGVKFCIRRGGGGGDLVVHERRVMLCSDGTMIVQWNDLHCSGKASDLRGLLS